jgi:diadenosine tetraphosphate (Ap4A) HIT family hydrolase
MPTLIHRRVDAARRGENPTVITKLPSGWVVLGDVQFLRGYCLLLPDPVVPHLNAMDMATRTQFLTDMTRLGDAILAETGAVRMNYEMLGNLEPALHAHVFPRYDNEPDDKRTKPVWFYDWNDAPAFEPTRDAPLMQAIARRLQSHA